MTVLVKLFALKLHPYIYRAGSYRIFVSPFLKNRYFAFSKIIFFPIPRRFELFRFRMCVSPSRRVWRVKNTWSEKKMFQHPRAARKRTIPIILGAIVEQCEMGVGRQTFSRSKYRIYVVCVYIYVYSAITSRFSISVNILDRRANVDFRFFSNTPAYKKKQEKRGKIRRKLLDLRLQISYI